MSLTLDHLFIMTAPNAPAAERLIDLGMVEGNANTHPGQGTANRRFFFETGALELMFLIDNEEAQSGSGRDLRLYERATSENVSPFGLILRADSERDADSFPGWWYQPDYFARGQRFVVGETAADLSEPACIVMPPNLPKRPPVDVSPAPFRRITNVTVSAPVEKISEALAATIDACAITFETAATHTLTVTFEGSDSSVDLAPGLPLRLRY